MKRCPYLVAPVLVALVSATTAWSQVPIAPLHCNDASGVPLANGTAVTVRGIVTGNQPSGSNSRFYIQDATGGINVFGTPQFCGSLGDDVEVSGTITHFNGLVEVIGPLTLTVHSSGNPQPAPLVLSTPNDVVATYDAGTNCEPNESRLVNLPNVFVRTSTGAIPTGNYTANTNYRLINAGPDSTTNFVTMRVVDSSNLCMITNSLVGAQINPGCSSSVTGIIVQFDSSAPHTSGYQLTPRMDGDVIANCPTHGRTTTWGKLKTIYR